ncbi:MAG: hypothetical protein ISQ32_04315 [Rickettsiales bacterium]|nr:hypothetical protein [Rickettsiales bacterium]
MKLKFILKLSIIIFLFKILNAGNLIAGIDDNAQKDKINFRYNILYNADQLNYNKSKYSFGMIESNANNFYKDKTGRLISFNDEKIQNEKILDFVGMFTSRYNSNKNLRVKLRVNNSYEFQKAVIAYKIRY